MGLRERLGFLGEPGISVALLWVLTLANYNWYPFNAGRPYSSRIVTPSPEATRYLIFSHSLEAALVMFFALWIPLSYVAWRIETFRPKRGGLALIVALPLLCLLGMVITTLPAYMEPLTTEEWGLWAAVPGFNLLLLYSALMNFILHGTILMTLSLYFAHGDFLRRLKEGEGATWAVLTVVAILMVDFVVGSLLSLYIDEALKTLTRCNLCIYPYFRGWHPEAARLVEEALREGKLIVFGKPPTWGQLTAETLRNILDGAILARYLKGSW